MDSFQLIVQFGAIAVLFLGIAAIMHGDLHSSSTLKAKEDAIARLDARVAQLLAEHAADVAALRAEHAQTVAILREEMERRARALEAERDYFRDAAFRAIASASRTTDIAARAVDLASSERTERRGEVMP